LPVSYVDRIERIPGVRNVEANVHFAGYYQSPANTFGGLTLSDSALQKKEKGRAIVSEEALSAMRSTRTGIVVGKKLADRFGWKVGDRLPLHLSALRKDRSNVWLFDIVGTWDVKPNAGESADQVWVNYDYYDEARVFDNGTVNFISTWVNDPAQVERIAQQIDRLFANSGAETETQSLAAAIRAELSGIIDIQLMINAVLGAVFFALLFVTGNTMMQSVRERTPEFAILKTHGFPDVVVSGLVLTESVIVCVFGALVGILVASELLFPVVFAAFDLNPLPMPPSVIAIGVAIAIALAVVTGLPPALRAGRLNIVDALAAK